MSHSYPATGLSSEELADVARSGAERARQALETLLGQPISIVETHAWMLPDSREALLDRIAAGEGSLGRLSISGPPDGVAWVAVPNPCVERLMQQYGAAIADDHDGSMASSVVAEVANIVTGSYVIELGHRWGVDLDPSPADLGVPADVARAELAALEAAGPGAAPAGIAVGCGFADSEGTYDLSVVVLLDSTSIASDD